MQIEVISREPATASSRPPLLFIHGGFHGAWCWDEHFLGWFASRGWSAHALSLRGHAGSEGVEGLLNWTLADYVEDVTGVMGRLGDRVILIGHSMGGVIGQMCHERSSAVAGLVLLASSPPRASAAVVARILFKHPVSLIVGQIRRDSIQMRHALEEFFFSPRLKPELREAYRRKLSGESLTAVNEVFSRPAPLADGPDRAPVLVIGGREDWSIPVRDHEKLGEDYGAPVRICKGAHDLMLDPDWEDSALAIEAWLDEQFPGAGAAGSGTFRTI